MPRRLSLTAALVAALLLVTGCDTANLSGTVDEDPRAQDGVLLSARQQASAVVADQYIVVFKEHVSDAPGLARSLAAAHGGEIRFTYEHALKGFAGRFSAQAAEALRRNPNVAYVEADQTVHVVASQTNATWGLDRIDQRANTLDNTYNYTSTGAGVHAYIVDTGIRTSHSDFGGRASAGFDAFNDGQNGQDCNGHGTHVAGTVGGTTWGVAKDVALVAVRVLDCGGSGTTSGVIAGVDWVTANALKPAVANMSLGGGASTSLDEAVRNSIASGVSYAVAAGNGNMGGVAQDACNYSPARVAEAMTIGATDKTDTKASWSNYGACVDWFGPGVSITSAWYTSDTDTRTISGTSMATPHVAGVAALYLAGNPGASTQQVRDALYAATTKGIVQNSSTANNHLLYSFFDGSGGGEGGGGTTGISLSASGTKVKGRNYVDLSWSGAASTQVDVFRNGAKVATTANDGEHRDDTGTKGSASFTYKVCEAGTTTCSSEATVVF